MDGAPPAIKVIFFKIDPGGRQGHVLNFQPGLIQIPPQGDYYDQGPGRY
jgi:hypothetical protein